MTAVRASQDRGDRLRQVVRRHWVWLPMVAVFTWVLLPLGWAFLASLKTDTELYSYRLLPEDPSLAKYREVLGIDGFWVIAANSLFLAVGTTIVTVIVGSLAGYAFARYAFPFRHFLLLLIFIPRLVPGVSLLVPLFQLADTLGVTDTRLAVLITHIGSAVPFAAWIMAGFFASVPYELEEAAFIDGAGLLATLRRVVLPLAWPGVVTVAVWSFVVSWNEFPFVLALIFSTEKRTLPIQLFLLRDSIGIVDWPLMNAFTMLTILPVLALYVIMQRWVVSGLVQGSLK